MFEKGVCTTRKKIQNNGNMSEKGLCTTRKKYKIMVICSKKVYVPCDVLKYCLMKIVLFPQKLSNYN